MGSCPARSSWTNKLITAKDHASVQINVGHLNENGQYDGTFTTIALAGKVRAMVSTGSARQPPLEHFLSGLSSGWGMDSVAWLTNGVCCASSGHWGLGSGHTLEEEGRADQPALMEHHAEAQP